MNMRNSNSISQQHGEFTAAEAENMLFKASHEDLEEDLYVFRLGQLMP